MAEGFEGWDDWCHVDPEEKTEEEKDWEDDYEESEDE